jgi:hypothetical protein
MHDTPRVAGAMLLVPTDHGAAFAVGDVLLDGLATALRALPDVDFNAWLVADPRRRTHWYVELCPRIGNLAGIELALGMSVAIAGPHAMAVAARERLLAN